MTVGDDPTEVADGPTLIRGAPDDTDAQNDEQNDEQGRRQPAPGEGDLIAGRFELGPQVGVGGMAAVYRARDRDTGGTVAVKLLKDAFLDRPSAVDAFEREAERTAALDDPGVAAVIATGRDGDSPYMAMEFLDGTPLARTLKMREGRPVSWARTLDFAAAVARTLAAVHSHGIVHCDLKPGNLFQTKDGFWRVLDFGAARDQPIPRSGPTPVRTHRRLSPEPALDALTPAYASPERLGHQEPDIRDDVFSLAVITYEFLTGLHPFGRLPSDQAQTRGLRPPRPAGIPTRAWKTLRAGLAFERKARPKTMTEFLRGVRRRPWLWPKILLVTAIGIGGIAGVAALRPDLPAAGHLERVWGDLELGGRAGLAYFESDEAALRALLDLKAADGPLGPPAVALAKPLMEDRLRRLAEAGPDSPTDRLRTALWAAGAGRTLYPDDDAILQLGERPFNLLLLDLADRLGRDAPMPRAVLVGDVALLRTGNPPDYAGVEDVIVDLISERLRKLTDPAAVKALTETARELFPGESWAESTQ
ncbi:MAG: serine/threonine-protein kinase [Thalassobaculaceae bacterium]